MQPSGQKGGFGIGMSCRLRHPGFDSTPGALLDYTIHGSDRWSGVSRILLRGGFKGPALLRFHVIIFFFLILIIQEKDGKVPLFFLA